MELLLDEVVLGFEESSAAGCGVRGSGGRLLRATGEGDDDRLDDHLKPSKELAAVKAATVAPDCPAGGFRVLRKGFGKSQEGLREGLGELE
jgi:hypothetical protein